jgi:hypothetical protein
MITPHVWIMDSGSVMHWIPKCHYCGWSSVYAQEQQPDAKGAGPCHARFKEWLERHGDGPDTIP